MKLSNTQQKLLEEVQLDVGHGYVYDMADEDRDKCLEAWLENPGNRELVATYLSVGEMSLEYAEVPTDFWDDVVDFMQDALEQVQEELGL